MTLQKRIPLLVIGLSAVLGLFLALRHRGTVQGVISVSDEDLLHCTMSLNTIWQDSIPSLSELETGSQEILLVRPVSRQLIKEDVLTSLIVIKVFHSARQYKTGDQIWLFEPYGLRTEGDTAPAVKSISAFSYTNPLLLGEEYLVFLNRREISELYQYSERDLNTFVYANRAVGAFSVNMQEIVLQVRLFSGSDGIVRGYTENWSQEARNNYLKERYAKYTKTDYTWQIVKDYSFITSDYYGFIPDNEKAESLRGLALSVREKYMN